MLCSYRQIEETHILEETQTTLNRDLFVCFFICFVLFKATKYFQQPFQGYMFQHSTVSKLRYKRIQVCSRK